jgi:hypothetical protein
MPSEGQRARDVETERVVRVPSALGCGEKDKKRSLLTSDGVDAKTLRQSTGGNKKKSQNDNT